MLILTFTSSSTYNYIRKYSCYWSVYTLKVTIYVRNTINKSPHKSKCRRGRHNHTELFYISYSLNFEEYFPFYDQGQGGLAITILSFFITNIRWRVGLRDSLRLFLFTMHWPFRFNNFLHVSCTIFRREILDSVLCWPSTAVRWSRVNKTHCFVRFQSISILSSYQLSKRWVVRCFNCFVVMKIPQILWNIYMYILEKFARFFSQGSFVWGANYDKIRYTEITSITSNI